MDGIVLGSKHMTSSRYFLMPVVMYLSTRNASDVRGQLQSSLKYLYFG